MQLLESTLGFISRSHEPVVVGFSPAYVIKSEGVPGVDASTRWTQSVELRFADGEIEGKMPGLPAVINAGRIAINNISYVGMIPVPLESAGVITLELEFVEGEEKLAITGEEVKLDLIGDAKYIEHIPAA